MMLRTLLALCALAFTANAAAQDQPPPEATEVWSPVPVKVTAGATDSAPPSDAIVLFDGHDLSGWESVNGGGPARWSVAHGAITVAPGTGDIRTRVSFGDVQLHIEWKPPVLPASRTGQDRGNSGVFLQERYEVQVLDTYTNRTYVNGQAGSVYKQYAPLVNASRPAGQWQSYDIIYTAPRFAADHTLISPAHITVLQNGVLVQNNVTLHGSTTYRGQPAYEAHGDAPLRLQDHGHLVSFRNIWIRRL
ncbi:MAG: DUF1080 domain-containing protein [Alphaproteobacteria bacterium]